MKQDLHSKTQACLQLETANADLANTVEVLTHEKKEVELLLSDGHTLLEKLRTENLLFENQVRVLQQSLHRTSIDADTAVQRVKELEVSLSRSFDQSAVSMHASSFLAEQDTQAQRELSEKWNESQQQLQEVEAKLVTSQMTERAYSSERESLLLSIRRLESVVSRQKHEIEASQSALRNAEADVISLRTRMEEATQQHLQQLHMVARDKERQSSHHHEHLLDEMYQLRAQLDLHQRETTEKTARLEQDLSKQATMYARELEEARRREKEEKAARHIAEKKYEMLLLKVGADLDRSFVSVTRAVSP